MVLYSKNNRSLYLEYVGMQNCYYANRILYGYGPMLIWIRIIDLMWYKSIYDSCSIPVWFYATICLCRYIVLSLNYVM